MPWGTLCAELRCCGLESSSIWCTGDENSWVDYANIWLLWAFVTSVLTKFLMQQWTCNRCANLYNKELKALRHFVNLTLSKKVCAAHHDLTSTCPYRWPKRRTWPLFGLYSAVVLIKTNISKFKQQKCSKIHSDTWINWSLSVLLDPNSLYVFQSEPSGFVGQKLQKWQVVNWV